MLRSSRLRRPGRAAQAPLALALILVSSLILAGCNRANGAVSAPPVSGLGAPPPTPAPPPPAPPGADLVTQLNALQQQLGVPVQVEGQAPIPGGFILFFRYSTGTRCGFGHMVMRSTGSGGGGHGEGPCGAPQALGMSGMGSGAPGGPDALAVSFGEINDPRVARVIVTYPDGKQAEAGIYGSVWALIYPGQDRPPQLKQVAGLDAAGKEVAKAP